jgi:hypothetical protein
VSLNPAYSQDADGALSKLEDGPDAFLYTAVADAIDVICDHPDSAEARRRRLTDNAAGRCGASRSEAVTAGSCSGGLTGAAPTSPTPAQCDPGPRARNARASVLGPHWWGPVRTQRQLADGQGDASPNSSSRCPIFVQ